MKFKISGNNRILFIILILIVIIGAAYMVDNPDSSKKKVVVLETNMGDITIELYDDMPITTENFASLVEKEFYDGTIFHRIIPEFMIQGGDPQGTGMGGPGYEIKDEFTHEGGNKNNRGTISMANSGPNTGGSQFFINVRGNNLLDDKHPAFGSVIEGMNVVDKIVSVERGANDKPVKDVVIVKARIV